MEIITFGDHTKPAIVFLHGWGGGFSSFIYFAKVMAKNFYCIVCDFNDLINSDKVLGVKDFADALYFKLADLKIKEICLVGHSFGGRVAGKFAFLYPKLVKKIILVDSAGLPPRRSLWYYIKVKRYKLYKWLAGKGLMKKEKLLKFGSTDFKNLKPELRATFIKIVNEDLTNCFSSITCPTLIYWGEKDKDTPIYMAKKLNKIIKDSGLVVVKNAGHYSYLEDVNKFIIVMNKFLI